MKKKTKIRLVILLSILILVLGAYLGINYYIDNMLSKVVIEEVEPADINIVVDESEKAHDVVNIMLVGADNLDWGNRENSYVEQSSDVFKIVSLDYTDKEIKLISLDRDIVVWIPDKSENGEFGRFNWAYSFGGAKYALGTINYNLDLDVSKYVTFSFAGFKNVIDILGGIDIELTKEEAEAFNGLRRSNAVMNINAVEGINHLDGYDALAYARQRYVDSDFNRMDRQNNVINAVIDKFKGCSSSELFSIVNECLPYITTNIKETEIKNYITDILKFNLTDIKKQTYPVNETDDVCWNKEGIGGYLLRSYSNQVKEIHKFIYEIEDYIPSQRIFELEEKTYETYGDFYENSELIP